VHEVISDIPSAQRIYKGVRIEKVGKDDVRFGISDGSELRGSPRKTANRESGVLQAG
jgi:hypothetical protein